MAGRSAHVVVLTKARDVRVPSANAVSQIRSVGRPSQYSYFVVLRSEPRACGTRECVRALDGYARFEKAATRNGGNARTGEDDLDDGASILVARRRVAKRR